MNAAVEESTSRFHWLPSPVLQDASLLTTETSSEFLAHFEKKGYRKLDEVPVTRQLDTSVDFIGSNTSVVKQDLLAGQIPDTGVVLSQTCLRTQNLRMLGDETAFPDRCSVFRMIGATVSASSLSMLTEDCASWLRSCGLSVADRVVLWSSSEDDVLNHLIATKFSDFRTEKDTQAAGRYRHVYGVPGLIGRNFNIAIRADSGFVDQIGNLVLMELDGIPIAAELGISVPMTLSLSHGLRHPVLASPVSEKLTFSTVADIVLADCLAISQLLLAEGLRPRKKGRKRTLRAALRGAAELLPQSSNKLTAVEETIRHLFLSQGRDPADLPGRVATYIDHIRRATLAGEPGGPASDIALQEIL